ncbi:MAG: hypothetical protein ACO3DB_01555, partial [Candidatus Limnocylindrus sp.]
MFAGTASAATASNITKGQGPGDDEPTATPTYTWVGGSFSIALTIDRGSDTNPGSNSQQFELQFNGNPDICSLSGSTVTVTGAGQCVVLSRVFAGGDYDTGRTDEMEIIVNKGTQDPLQVLTDGTDGTSVTYSSPNGTVTLTNDGGGSGTGGVTYSYVSGDCDVDGNTVTITGGTNNCVVRATKAADSNYLVETDDATITVNKASQAALQVLTDGTDGTSVTYSSP